MAVVRRDPNTLVVVSDNSELAEYANQDRQMRVEGETARLTDSEGRLWIKTDEWVQVD